MHDAVHWIAALLSGFIKAPARLRGADMPVARLLVVSLAALVGLLVAALSVLSPDPLGPALSLSELDRLAGEQRVNRAVLLDQDHMLQGIALPPRASRRRAAATRLSRLVPTPQISGPFHVSYPANDATTSGVITRLSAAGAFVSVESQTDKAVVRLLTTTLLPILILANLFALFFASRGQEGIGGVEAFGQIDKQGRVGGAATFADIAGVEEAQEELNEVVDYLCNPERYAAVGATPPKGVLLFGPPGCGKTLLAKAVAGEAGVPFFSVAGAEFVESLVGVGAARVRDLFAKVRSVAPAILFIDELDAAGRRRGATGGGGSEERDNTLNQLLVEMDGFDVSSGIVIMAATNRPDILDPALLRPGRFDRHIIIDRPDVEHRQAILRLHASRRPIAPGVDFEALARQTPGFTGADLANVINEAALLTIRAGRTMIDPSTLSEAVQRLLGGPQRRGHLLTEEERRRVACHEAGHAVAAALLGHGNRVHRVSIVARGRGLGSSGFEREDSETIRTATQLRTRLVVALAGRASEELLLGEPSTGSEDDLELATRLAREMAGRYGLTPEVGLASLLEPAEGHLGPHGPQHLAVSESAWSAFDSAVDRLLAEGHAGAHKSIEIGRPALDALTAALLEREALDGAALAELLPAPLVNGEVGSILGATRNPARRRRSTAPAKQAK